MRKRLVFRVHALQAMFERRIAVEDVRDILEHGKVIESYPEDKPFPSRLVLGWRGSRPIHVVAADDEDNQEIIITAYEPDRTRWEPNFEKRKKS